MSRNVETTLDLRFSAAGEACAAIACSADGDVARQAELLCLARYVARSLNLVEPERRPQLIGFLLEVETLPTGSIADVGTVRVVPVARDFPLDASTRVVCRFIDARHEPRMFFSVKTQAFRVQPGQRDRGDAD